jgi:ATP-binding cassette subfamily B protein
MFHGHIGGWWQYVTADEKQKPQVNRQLLRRVWNYALPYRGRIVFVLVAIGLSTILGLLPPLIYRQLIDHTLPERDFQQLNWLALAMIAVPLSTGLIEVAQRNQSARVGEGLICDLRQELYKHMQNMSLRFFTNTKTGEIMARLNNDVVGAQRAVTGTLISIVTNVIQVILTLAIMLSLNWGLTLISVTIVPLFLVAGRRVADRLRDVTRRSFNLNAKMNALMNETLNVSGALLMKIFGRQRENMTQFRTRSQAVADIGVRSAVIGRWFFMGLGLISAIGTALVFWLGGHLVLRGAFSIGTIIAFATYLRDLYGPISTLANARVDFATSMVSFERVFEVIDLPVEIADSPDAHDLTHVEGRVRFDNVSFSYAETSALEADNGSRGRIAQLRSQARFGPPGRGHSGGTGDDPDYARAGGREWATENVTFEIAPGQLAALVGPSGAGKTTLTYLLPRLYDPRDGQITIDGIDLREIHLDTLAKNIGMVTQETYLFHDTIRANLLYAQPTASDADLHAVCRAAHLAEFIKSLPDGFDTIVGERGYRLSGGEKQRVAIARVILKDPRILILDEATSSLDSRSEALIQAALRPLFQGRTSLVIAHRLSTILASDVILVMDAGRLVEKGTHNELLALNGLYADLYKTQFESQTPPAVTC